jgi:hypothetical protein
MFVSKVPTFRAGLPTLATTTLVALVLLGCEDDSKKPASTADASASGADTDTPNNVPNRPTTNPPNNNPPVQSLPPAVPVEGPETELCGDTNCRDRLVGDIVVEPCCVNGDSCGLDVSAVSGFMPVSGGCVALDQPGSTDPACPSVYFDDVANPRQLAGCCRPDGVCGVVADLSDTLANFGCVDPNEFLAGRGEQSPPRENGDDEPGVHLTDGGGFYVTDGGSGAAATAGECVPRLPEPEPADAAVDAAPSDAAPSEAGASSDAASPVTSAPGPNAPDVGVTTPAEEATTSTLDAATGDAG